MAILYAGMLPGVTRRRMLSFCAALLVALTALSGCRQAPIDPGYRVPAPDETPPPAPARVDFTVPDGFVESYDHHIVSPLYPAPAAEFLVPSDSGPENGEAIVVASYLMDVDVAGENDAQLAARVKGYAASLKSAVTEPVKSSVDGLSAFTITIREPSSSGGFYTYDATFVFSGTHMVETICQYSEQKALVDKACAEVLSSMKVIVA